MLTPNQNNLDWNRPPHRQIRWPIPTIGELAYRAGRLIVNLQRVIIQPLKGQAIATDRTENRFVETQRHALIVDIDILANRTRGVFNDGFHQNCDQLLIGRNLPTKLLLVRRTATEPVE